MRSTNGKAKPQAETQKAWRERMKANGFIHFQAWVHAHQMQAIQDYLKKDNERIQQSAAELTIRSSKNEINE